MSAVAVLQATVMFHTVARRSNALTSGSCGCGSSRSQKKIRTSMTPSAIFAPICWSPPTRPLRKHVRDQCDAPAAAGNEAPLFDRRCLHGA